MSDLDSNDGFVMNVGFVGQSGISVSSAGDVNGDGVTDLLIGANRADVTRIGAGFSYDVIGAGESYVVFGIAPAQCNGLFVTTDISAGDVPTSGDDVILGTPTADIINALDGNDTICGAVSHTHLTLPTKRIV